MQDEYAQMIDDTMEEILLEFATVYTGEDIPLKIIVSVDENRIGNPYFKVFNANDFKKATKMARISFLEPKYVIHSMNYGKENWVLNSKEKKLLINALTSLADINCTVWQSAVIDYNREHGVSIFKQRQMTKEQLIEKHLLPLDLEMPDYTKL